MAERPQPPNGGQQAPKGKPAFDPQVLRSAAAFFALGGARPEPRLVERRGPIDRGLLLLLQGLMIYGTYLYHTEGIDDLIALFPSDRWTFEYLFGSTINHIGLLHFAFNWLALLGLGTLILPFIGGVLLTLLFWLAALGGHLANNLLGGAPAFGMSAGILGIFAFIAVPFRGLPVKLILISNLLRLKPFKLWMMAYVIVLIDVLGIVLDWHFFAHWAHLGGFATGLIFAAVYFRRPLLMMLLIKLHNRRRSGRQR